MDFKLNVFRKAVCYALAGTMISFSAPVSMAAPLPPGAEAILLGDSGAIGFKIEGKPVVVNGTTINTEVEVLNSESSLSPAVAAINSDLKNNPTATMVVVPLLDGQPADQAVLATAQNIASGTNAKIVSQKAPSKLRAFIDRNSGKLKTTIALLRGGSIGAISTVVLVSQNIPLPVAASVGLTLGSIALTLGYFGKQYLKFVGHGSFLSQSSHIFVVEVAKFTAAALVLALNGVGGQSIVERMLGVLATSAKTTAIKGTFDISIEEIDHNNRTEANARVADVVRDFSLATISVTETSLATAEIAGWEPARILLLGMSAAGAIVLITTKHWFPNLAPYLPKSGKITAWCERALKIKH